jgi:hypothetical protein
MAMNPVKIRAEGSTLTLEPVLTNKLGQKVCIAKNPPSWKMMYSVWVKSGSFFGGMGTRGFGVLSQHRTKAAALTAAKRVANKDVLKVLGWR